VTRKGKVHTLHEAFDGSGKCCAVYKSAEALPHHHTGCATYNAHNLFGPFPSHANRPCSAACAMLACLAASDPNPSHILQRCLCFLSKAYRSVTEDVGASLALEAHFVALVLMRSLQQAPVDNDLFRLAHAFMGLSMSSALIYLACGLGSF
jgi:hypothetical protein